jgi:hypothetical protein
MLRRISRFRSTKVAESIVQRGITLEGTSIDGRYRKTFAPRNTRAGRPSDGWLYRVISEYLTIGPGDMVMTGPPSGSAGLQGNRG